MRSKTDTLRAIRRNQDYAMQRETTLALIEQWWVANANATPSEGGWDATKSKHNKFHSIVWLDIFNQSRKARLR